MVLSHLRPLVQCSIMLGSRDVLDSKPDIVDCPKMPSLLLSILNSDLKDAQLSDAFDPISSLVTFPARTFPTINAIRINTRHVVGGKLESRNPVIFWD